MRWVIALVLASAALCLETHVIPESDLRKRVKMTPIAPEWIPFDKPFRATDFVISWQDESWLVRGRDRASKDWTASLLPAARSLWRTDMDGVKTYWIFGYTGAAGIGPPTWTLALTFDSAGRPNPFYAIGYVSHLDDGIADLLDLDGAGPQFVQQDWVGTNWDRRDAGAQSGYYVTTLYAQKGVFWYRSDGHHGATSFPLFERWSRWAGAPPQLVPMPPDFKTEWIPDYSNDPANGVRNAGCNVEGVDVVVRDSSRGREIEMRDLSRTDAPAGIATGIRRRTDGCRISVLWSTSNR